MWVTKCSMTANSGTVTPPSDWKWNHTGRNVADFKQIKHWQIFYLCFIVIADNIMIVNSVNVTECVIKRWMFLQLFSVMLPPSTASKKPGEPLIISDIKKGSMAHR